MEIAGDGALSQKGDTFNYTSTIAFVDLSGNPLFTFCGKATGTRFQ